MYLNTEEIEKLVKNFEKDTKAVKSELYRLCWYMRGGLSLSEAFLLTYEDKEIIAKIIEDNLNTTKETQMPFF